jgi:hypothetical protein
MKFGIQNFHAVLLSIYVFHLSWIKFVECVYKNVLNIYTLHSYGLILVELGISNLNISLLSIYEFDESWNMEAIFLLQVLVKLYLDTPPNWVMCRK